MSPGFFLLQQGVNGIAQMDGWVHIDTDRVERDAGVGQHCVGVVLVMYRDDRKRLEELMR